MEASTEVARRAALAEPSLAEFIARQRWFGGKGAQIDGVSVLDVAPLGDSASAALAVVRQRPGGAEPRDEIYFVPLATAEAAALATLPPEALITSTAIDAGGAHVIDASRHDAAVLALGAWIATEARVPGREGEFVAERAPAFDDAASAAAGPVRRMNVEQSNTSLVLGEAIVLKLYRHVHAGPQPELEFARFLSAARFANTPALLGSIEYRANDGSTTACAIAQRFVRSDGDAWTVILERLVAQLRAPDEIADAELIARVARMGVRTAELHRALATPLGDPAFDPEVVTQSDLDAWNARARESAEAAFAALEARVDGLEPLTRARARALVRRRADALERLQIVAEPASLGRKTRYHGDFHLGQLLAVGDDVTIVDFEGEPARPLAERRKKSSPLRDVAGMLRSFDYVTSAAERALAAELPSGASSLDLAERARTLRERLTTAYLDAYAQTLGACDAVPADTTLALRLLDLFVLEKACYEVSYELANRPLWVEIPLGGLERLLDLTGIGGRA